MKNKKTLHKKSIIYLILVSFISLTAFIFLYIKQTETKKQPSTTDTLSQSNPTNYSKPSNLELEESSRNKNEVVDSMDKPQSTAFNSSSPISVTITRASRTSVGVYVEKLSEGTCNLSIAQNGIEKISMNSKIIPLSEYSTCEGFNIDSSKLDETPFKVNIAVSSGDRKGSATQEVN